MNLCDRLQIRTPCGYGNRYHFSFRGECGWDKGTVVFVVAERYARRFGEITQEKANAIYLRLAKRYCWGIGWLHCFNSLKHNVNKSDDFVFMAHPKASREASGELWLKFEKAKQAIKQIEWDVDSATAAACGNRMYCDFDVDDSENYYKCILCGCRCKYELHIPGKERSVTAWVRVKSIANNFVCRNSLCKALAHQFKTECNSRSHFPMAKILYELTKPKTGVERAQEVAKSALRNINATNERGHRRKRSESGGEFSAAI